MHRESISGTSRTVPEDSMHSKAARSLAQGDTAVLNGHMSEAAHRAYGPGVVSHARCRAVLTMNSLISTVFHIYYGRVYISCSRVVCVFVYALSFCSFPYKLCCQSDGMYVVSCVLDAWQGCMCCCTFKSTATRHNKLVVSCMWAGQICRLT